MQVDRMFEVYQNSTLVIACVGEHDTESRVLFEFFEEFESLFANFEWTKLVNYHFHPTLEAWTSHQEKDGLLLLYKHFNL